MSSTATPASIELVSPAPESDAVSTGDESRLESIAPEPDIVEASRLVDSAAPDGGYGWVVLFGCAMLTWLFIGTTYSWGVIQASLVKDGVSSASTLSFVGSLTVACLSIFAIINARIIRLLGSQKTALIGISLFGLGEIASSFSTHNIAGLFVATGIIMGIGVGLCFMVVSVTPAQYFNKKRGLANGIVYAGGGLGGAVTSFAMNEMIQKVGPAWTYRIMGFITLATGLPAAWVIKERTPIRSATFIEWRLFRDVRFTLLFFAGALATFPLFVPPFFLPLYSASLGLSPSIGAGLVAGFNFASAVGRIGCGLLSDRFGPLNTLFGALVLCAASMLALWPISSSVAPLIVFVVVNGMANGGFFATMPTVVGNVFGSARVSVAMGMIVTGWAAGYLMGAPIAGYLLDAYGGRQAGFQAYRPAIFWAGGMAAAAAALVGFMRGRKVFVKL